MKPATRAGESKDVAWALVLLSLLSMLVAGGHDTLATTTSNPYAQWQNGPPADPDFFPIGVWLQDPALAPQYKEAGINVYVGLHGGPTVAQLAILRHYGMRVIAAQNAVGLRYRDDPTIVGWMQQDEPDNAQPLEGGGYGPPVPPEQVISEYERIRTNDPTRPVWLNLGQGVANDRWQGRGPNASLDDYIGYVQGGDIISFDVYPVASLGSEEFIWYVGKGLDRLNEWTDGSKILWNVVEAARINSKSNPPRKVTPHELRAQVWMSLIHGSRGIVYFVHEWEPKFNAAALLSDPVLLPAVTHINQQIHALAPVLNSPSVNELVTVTSGNPAVPIRHMVKQDDRYLYIFAVGMRNAATTGTFTVHGLTDFAVEVLGEERTIPGTDGAFEVAFGPYDVLLARIAMDS